MWIWLSRACRGHALSMWILRSLCFRSINPLLPEEALSTVAELTLDKLTATLLGCKNSYPWLDGLPYLYSFWKFYGPIHLKACQYSLLTKDHPRHNNSHTLDWYPRLKRMLGLYVIQDKLINKTYSKKLTSVISNYIGHEQTAYVTEEITNIFPRHWNKKYNILDSIQVLSLFKSPQKVKNLNCL